MPNRKDQKRDNTEGTQREENPADARGQKRKTTDQSQGETRQAKASGLCRHCGEPAIEGQTRCDRCAERHRLSGRSRHQVAPKAKEAREMAQAMAPAENIPAGGPTKCRECQDPPRPGQPDVRCATRHNENRRRRREAKRRPNLKTRTPPQNGRDNGKREHL